METKGIEPSTPGLQSRQPSDVSAENKALTATASPACTAACTRNPENDNATAANQAGDQAAKDAEPVAGQGADSLAALAAALKGLSTADRAKLAAMLVDGDDGDTAADRPKARGKAKRTTKRPARKGDVRPKMANQNRGPIMPPTKRRGATMRPRPTEPNQNRGAMTPC